jgi:hypothetical protein
MQQQKQMPEGMLGMTQSHIHSVGNKKEEETYGSVSPANDSVVMFTRLDGSRFGPVG